MIKISNRYVIDTPVITILKTIRSETALQGDMFLRDIKQSGASSVLVTCPFHKNHNEKKPACSVFIHDHESGWKEGQFHCFACGATGDLADLVAACFNSSDVSFGEEWLKERYGNTLISSVEYLPEITLDNKKEEKTFLDESILTEYDYYHPYMWHRKLSKEVVDMFRIGYDKTRDAITFPVYDEKHRLVMVTARSVNTKMFWIPSRIEKPLYLFDNVLQNNITNVIVTEGQLDALTAWSYGHPAVATMGCPSEKHIQLLNNSGIRVIIAMFDNDSAGKNFTKRLKKHLNKDIFFMTAKFPEGVKDINDLSKEQFDNMLNNLSW